jgi:hypothetical protein
VPEQTYSRRVSAATWDEPKVQPLLVVALQGSLRRQIERSGETVVGDITHTIASLDQWDYKTRTYVAAARPQDATSYVIEFTAHTE